MSSETPVVIPATRRTLEELNDDERRQLARAHPSSWSGAWGLVMSLAMPALVAAVATRLGASFDTPLVVIALAVAFVTPLATAGIVEQRRFMQLGRALGLPRAEVRRARRNLIRAAAGTRTMSAGDVETRLASRIDDD